MRRILLGVTLALILAGAVGCQTVRSTLTQALPWIHPTPTPASYMEQMGDALEGVRGWVPGVMKCFAPLRMLGLDRETARDCHPKELHRDAQRILQRLKAISPPAAVKGPHDRLIVGLEELLKVIEDRRGQSGTTPGQQFQAIGALERITKALQEIGDFIGQAEG